MNSNKLEILNEFGLDLLLFLVCDEGGLERKLMCPAIGGLELGLAWDFSGTVWRSGIGFAVLSPVLAYLYS